MIFLTLGIFWVAQVTQTDALAHSNRDQTWIHLGFLAAVSMVPFSTVLLGEFWHYHVAMVVYWFNIAMLGLVLWLAWSHAERQKLLVDGWNATLMAAVRRRILGSQSFYLAAMLVSILGAGYGLAIMLVVQLNYAAAPRIGRRLG